MGIFGLINRLAREGRLTPEQEEFRRVNNAWYDGAYTDPGKAVPGFYDVHPGAVAWFKSSTAGHLIARADGYLEILAAHEVGCERVTSDDVPGVIVYEDVEQVVVLPTPGIRSAAG